MIIYHCFILLSYIYIRFLGFVSGMYSVVLIQFVGLNFKQSNPLYAYIKSRFYAHQSLETTMIDFTVVN